MSKRPTPRPRSQDGVDLFLSTAGKPKQRQGWSPDGFATPDSQSERRQEAPACTALRPALGTAPRGPPAPRCLILGPLGPGQLCIPRSHAQRATSTGGAGPAHRPPCRSPNSKGRLHLPSSSLTLQKMPKAERGRDSDSGRRQEEPPGCPAETCACPGLPDHAGDPGPTRVGSAGGPASCSSGPTGPGAACRVLDQRPRLPGELGPPSGRPMSSCPVTARQQGLLGRTSVGARAHELTASLGAGWLGTRARGGSLSGHFPVSNSHCNIICDPKRRPWGPRASEFSVRSLPRAGGGGWAGGAALRAEVHTPRRRARPWERAAGRWPLGSTTGQGGSVPRALGSVFTLPARTPRVFLRGPRAPPSPLRWEGPVPTPAGRATSQKWGQAGDRDATQPLRCPSDSPPALR